MGERASDETLADRLYIEVCLATHRPQDTAVAGGGGTGGGVGVLDGGYSSLYPGGDVRPTTPSGLETMAEDLHPAAGPHQLSPFPFPFHTRSGLQAAICGTSSCPSLQSTGRHQPSQIRSCPKSSSTNRNPKPLESRADIPGCGVFPGGVLVEASSLLPTRVTSPASI